MKLKLTCLCVWNFYIYIYIQEWVKLMIFFLMSLFEFIRVMLTSQFEMDGSPFSSMAGKNLYKPAWPVASKASGTCLWNHLALHFSMGRFLTIASLFNSVSTSQVFKLFYFFFSQFYYKMFSEICLFRLSFQNSWQVVVDSTHYSFKYQLYWAIIYM